MNLNNQKKISFNRNFFEKKDFDHRTIQKYFKAAQRDLKIANTNQEVEVIFKFSYSALIKMGICLISFHNYRVKSRSGHHIKILKKLSQILQNEDIEIIGNKMRKKRNFDLYEGGVMIASKEAEDYLYFVKEVFIQANGYLKKQNSLFP
jgi:hypothetical protein